MHISVTDAITLVCQLILILILCSSMGKIVLVHYQSQTLSLFF